MEDPTFLQNFWYFFWSVLWLVLLIAWFWVLIAVVADIFRSKDLSGVSKALWVLFVIVIPWLGVLMYIVVRGHKMEENSAEAAARMRAQMGASAATELAQLASLKEGGHITEAEFNAQKAKILGA